VRHFDFLSDTERAALFSRMPGRFGPADDPALLAVALGATLYSPATRPDLAADLARRAANGVTSAVICLEDAIADCEVAAAEHNAVNHLRTFHRNGHGAPLLFVRVRAPGQIPLIVEGLGEHVDVLTGFVVPKFTRRCGSAYLDQVRTSAEASGHRLLAMPVIEAPKVVHAESRMEELLGIRELLQANRDIVLAVRLGATDFAAAYGMRRARDLTVYDVGILAGVIADVVNVFGRSDGSGFVVTGPVWEYFSGSERLFKPQLRESPFIEHSERALRTQLIAKDLDALIREVVLDKANGLTGKTVIHPTHVAAVHALSVVTHEEYTDATDILDTGAAGGVSASSYGNKMNESKPHSAWARRIVDRAEVFGVAHPTTSFVDLLGAGLNQ
jgi:citrate lyase beta subunit